MALSVGQKVDNIIDGTVICRGCTVAETPAHLVVEGIILVSNRFGKFPVRAEYLFPAED